ncbi:MAG TPA: hypothetical protein VGN17_00505 [Bryobacteraceae bacterium]|jgi:hypothetical protein
MTFAIMQVRRGQTVNVDPPEPELQPQPTPVKIEGTLEKSSRPKARLIQNELAYALPDVARWLNVDATLLHRRVKSGELKAFVPVSFKSRLYIREADLAASLNRQ